MDVDDGGGAGATGGGGGDLVRKEMYLVKWKNLSYLHNSWEMSTHLEVSTRVRASKQSYANTSREGFSFYVVSDRRAQASNGRISLLSVGTSCPRHAEEQHLVSTCTEQDVLVMFSSMYARQIFFLRTCLVCIVHRLDVRRTAGLPVVLYIEAEVFVFLRLLILPSAPTGPSTPPSTTTSYIDDPTGVTYKRGAGPPPAVRYQSCIRADVPLA